MEILFIAVISFCAGAVTTFLVVSSRWKRARALEQMGENLNALTRDALKQNNELFLQLAGATFEKMQEKARGELEGDLLKPVKETLAKFDGKLQELERARTGAYSAIKEQLSSLLDSQKSLHKETANLVKALRSPVVRGRWGEIQLRRVVELAGMVDHCDFYEQESVTTEEGRVRPDLLIRLPGEKNIIIDAKAPLAAYLEAIETQDESLRAIKMKEHARHIRAHLTQLGRKSYWDQFQPTPEFVVLFLPGETFFSAALEHDPELIEMGADKRVILSTPTTLIALLRAIAYGWRQENLSRNAEEIRALGQDLHKRIADMASHFSKVGKSLGGAVQAYNKVIGSLETRVLVSARKFKELQSAGTDKEIEHLEPIEQTPRALQVKES